MPRIGVNRGLITKVKNPKEVITGYGNRNCAAFEINWEKVMEMFIRKTENAAKFLRGHDEDKGPEAKKMRYFIEKSSPDLAESREDKISNQQDTDYPQHSTSPQFVANQDVARKVMRGKITVSEAIEKLAEQGISPDISAWANITGDGSEEVQEVEKHLTEHRKRVERSEESTPDKEEIVTFDYKDSERQKLTDTEKKKYSELAKEHEEYKDFDTFDSNIEAMAKLLAHHDGDEKELMEAAEKRKRNLIVTGSYIPPMWKNILSKNNAWKIERGKFKKLNYLEEDDSPISISDAEHNWVQ